MEMKKMEKEVADMRIDIVVKREYDNLIQRPALSVVKD